MFADGRPGASRVERSHSKHNCYRKAPSLRRWQNYSSPMVSVLCATFNHASFVEQCLDGLLCQETDFPYEIIVRDDASADGTADILRQYEAGHPEMFRNIYEIENQFSKGVFPRETALPIARGEFLAWCDGDDVWTDPNKLQMQVDFLRENPSFSGCYTDFSLIDREGCSVGKENRVQKRRSFSHMEVLQKGCPKTLTLMIRRSSIADLIDRLPELRSIKNGDQLICAWATQSGEIAYLPKLTGAYRVGSGFWSTMQDATQSRTVVESFLKIAEIFVTDEERQAIGERLTRRLAEMAILRGKSEQEWCDGVKGQMSKLRLPFDADFYRREKSRFRWAQLKRKVRRFLPVR